MKIILLCIGETKNKELKSLEIQYLNRIKHYCPFELKVLPDIKRSKGASNSDIKIIEGKVFLNEIGAADLVFLLDENGKGFGSRSFADFLQKQMNTGNKRAMFVVGGAFGFSEEMYQRANAKVSLSAMTFSHEMIRTFFLEQVYRAFSILKGEPYHND